MLMVLRILFIRCHIPRGRDAFVHDKGPTERAGEAFTHGEALKRGQRARAGHRPVITFREDG